MDRRIATSFIVGSMLALLVGCAKDEGPLYIPKPVDPGEPIDTAYFNTEVVPIFIQHCWTCHPDMAALDLGATDGLFEFGQRHEQQPCPSYTRSARRSGWHRCFGTRSPNRPPMA